MFIAYGHALFTAREARLTDQITSSKSKLLVFAKTWSKHEDPPC